MNPCESRAWLVWRTWEDWDISGCEGPRGPRVAVKSDSLSSAQLSFGFRHHLVVDLRKGCLWGKLPRRYKRTAAPNCKWGSKPRIFHQAIQTEVFADKMCNRCRVSSCLIWTAREFIQCPIQGPLACCAPLLSPQTNGWKQTTENLKIGDRVWFSLEE